MPRRRVANHPAGPKFLTARPSAALAVVPTPLDLDEVLGLLRRATDRDAGGRVEA